MSTYETVCLHMHERCKLTVLHSPVIHTLILKNMENYWFPQIFIVIFLY